MQKPEWCVSLFPQSLPGSGYTESEAQRREVKPSAKKNQGAGGGGGEGKKEKGKNIPHYILNRI